MRRHTPESVSALLARGSGALHALVRHADLLRRVENVLARSLGTPVGRHFRVASTRDGVLVLHADSPAWSTKLRYLAPRIIEIVNRHRGLEAIEAVRVRVRPERPEPTPKRRRNRLSPSSARLIENVARETENRELRRVLLALARHV